MSKQFIFNQYYIDLLKRIKASAKKMRESDADVADAADVGETVEPSAVFGKTILKAIRENYTTLDQSSDEYTMYMKTIPEDFWVSYIGIDDISPSATDTGASGATATGATATDWFLADDVKDVCIYKGITVSSIRRLVNDDYMCHHFFSVFYLFLNELSDDDVKVYLSVLQDTKNEIGLDVITNEAHRKLIARLNELKTKKQKDTTGFNMSGMEDTMLGKLAKEILEDVDVEKLQKSIGDNGDILKAIGDPDSGFSELISNVSRKMANKISTGELKQENLLQDAIKFASAMPGGIFGNAGAAGAAGAANQGGGSGSGGNANQPDMASMMNMMSSMMNNKQGMDMFKNMMGNMNQNQNQRGGSRQTVNKPALKKLATVNKLKSKLAKRREEGE
jgi:hypothetical protein